MNVITTKKGNTLELHENHAILKIHSDTYGDFDVIIDLDDIDMMSEYRWGIMCAKSNKSDYCGFYVSGNSNKKLLHRLLTHTNDRKMFVDHINGNTLDNRKCNLRVCTQSENRHNSKTPHDNKSGRKGVIWYPYKGYNKWKAFISNEGVKINLGYFDTYEDACKARSLAESEYYGEYKNNR